MTTPDYLRVVEDISARIRSGELKPGEKLPSYRELADQFELSISTIMRAYWLLKVQGWVVGHQGKGTYVAPHPPV